MPATTSVLKVISENPVILTSKDRALGKGAIVTIEGLTARARAGLEPVTTWLRSQRSTIELPREEMLTFQHLIHFIKRMDQRHVFEKQNGFSLKYTVKK